jgi:hypothetical protein
MLTPEDLQNIEDKIKSKITFLNTYATTRIVQEMESVISKLDKNTSKTVFMQTVNKRASALFDFIKTDVKSQKAKLDKEVKQSFYEAAGKINYENEVFTHKVAKTIDKGIKLPELPKDDAEITKASDLSLTPKEQKALDNAYKETQKEIENITRTMPLAGQQTYINACNKAYYDVQNGIDLNTAIINAIKDVSAQGITTVQYNGRNDSVEVAIARAVRSGVNHAACESSLIRCNELGANFVRVSQHLGARVTPFNDYTNHSWWQGKIYHLDWSSPNLEKYDTTDQERNEIDKKHHYVNEINNILKVLLEKFNKYPDFVKTCGYGDIQGIAGVNCRHTFAPFYPGINVQTEKPLSKEENEKRYKETQTQRAMEVQIRKLKKQKAALYGSQNNSAEMKAAKAEINRKIKDKSNQYAQYCKDHNLPQANWRLQIS